MKLKKVNCFEEMRFYVGLGMLVQSESTCKAKQTPVHARAACGTACSSKLTPSFTERIPCITSPAACLNLSSLSVFSSLAWTSRSICDHPLAVSTCSIVFSIRDVLRPGLSPLGSRDKTLSYSSSISGSLCLRSSYALFQSCSDRAEGGDGTSEGACIVTCPVGAGKIAGVGGTEEDEVAAKGWTTDNGVAGS